MTDNTETGGNSTQRPQTRPSHLFLVRVWADKEREVDDEGNAEWCGKVQHVLTGRAGHFSDLEKIAAVFTSLMPEDGAEHIDVRNEGERLNANGKAETNR